MEAKPRAATRQGQPRASKGVPGATPDPFAGETEVGIFPTFFMAGFE
jgi:hypothetical protein